MRARRRVGGGFAALAALTALPLRVVVAVHQVARLGAVVAGVHALAKPGRGCEATANQMTKNWVQTYKGLILPYYILPLHNPSRRSLLKEGSGNPGLT